VEVYSTGWDLKNTYTGRVILTGLNDEHSYNVKALASENASQIGERLTTLYCGDRISNTTDSYYIYNVTYLILEQLTPTNG